MHPRLRAYLELVRVPNVFTAIADPLAGFLFAGGSLMNWPTLVAVCLASACLYSAGMVLNDVADAPRDAQSRPTRPIPSGRVPMRAAQLLCGFLLLTGSLLAATSGTRTALLALALIAAIVLYDAVLKPTPLAAPSMGLCRALNLALGMSAALPSVDVRWLLRFECVVPLALMWLYITSVTLFARREAVGDTRTRLTLATIGVTVAVLGLSTLPLILRRAGTTDKLSLSVPFPPGAMSLVTPPHTSALAPILLLAAFLAATGLRAAHNRSPASIQRAVTTFILCIIFFDACLTWTTAGPASAAAVALLFVPALAVSRAFRMT